MNFRPLLLVVPLLLTGCSTMSNMSWSSMSPLNWFGSSVEVSEMGIAGINASTPLNEAAINKALDDNYRLRSGMGTRNGTVTSFYQALDGDTVVMTISGDDSGKVKRVNVENDAIKTAWGVKIGTPFSDLYEKAYGVCQKGQGDNANDVECVSKESRHVSYLFSGEWRGPEGLMPSDDTLKDWKISQIVWHANAI